VRRTAKSLLAVSQSGAACTGRARMPLKKTELCNKSRCCHREHAARADCVQIELKIAPNAPMVEPAPVGPEGG
jgi:hypothetical protein